MATRASFRADRSSTALAVERSARDGVVHLRVPLTWIGVRTYVDPETGRKTRELRRPEQVWAASHIASLRLLTATHAHPVGPAGKFRGLPVMLDARADAEAGPGPDGQLRRPPALYQVGQVGDEIEPVNIDGHDLPVARVAIHGAAAVADIERGFTQTSLGYGCYIDRTPGVWTAIMPTPTSTIPAIPTPDERRAAYGKKQEALIGPYIAEMLDAVNAYDGEIYGWTRLTVPTPIPRQKCPYIESAFRKARWELRWVTPTSGTDKSPVTAFDIQTYSEPRSVDL